MALGLCLQRVIHIGSRLTQRGVSGDEAVRNGAQHGIGFTSHGQLITKALPLPTLTNANHANAKGLQHTPNVAFQILAEPDQAFTCPDKAAQPIRLFAADVNRRESVGARKLREAFCIGAVGLVQSRRQALVGLARIDADRGQAKLDHSTL